MDKVEEFYTIHIDAIMENNRTIAVLLWQTNFGFTFCFKKVVKPHYAAILDHSKIENLSAES